MKLIEFRNVDKSFKGRKVIRDLSFTINSNEIVALVGTNGAGKTTTIRMILGINRPDKGSIKYCTKDFNKKVGVQLQTTPFFEGFTVEENLKLFGTFYQCEMTNKVMQNILNKYNLIDVKNTLASKLSLGQQKRLAIGITTLHDPEFVILDEPSAGLDPEAQRNVQKLILQLKRRGKSVLFSSHDMLEVRNIADRIIIMDQGSLLESGEPESLLHKYDVFNLEELFYEVTKKERGYV